MELCLLGSRSTLAVVRRFDGGAKLGDATNVVTHPQRRSLAVGRRRGQCGAKRWPEERAEARSRCGGGPTRSRRTGSWQANILLKKNHLSERSPRNARRRRQDVAPFGYYHDFVIVCGADAGRPKWRAWAGLANCSQILFAQPFARPRRGRVK